MDESGDICSRGSQFLGQTEEEDAVLSLVLKKEYCDIDESNENRLLWKSHVEKVIKSGTLRRLVQQLAPHGEEIDHSYRTSFLAVYRTFATPSELLQELIKWFRKLSSKDEEDGIKRNTKKATSRSVLSFIRLWVEKYAIDFNKPPTYDLLTMLETFLKEQSESSQTVSMEASDLLKHVNELRHRLMPGGQALLHENGPLEERAIDDLYDWLNFLPVHVAWDMTALDATMFVSLIPHECLHYIRHQTDLSPTIYRSINHFNRIIRLVITILLQPVTTTRRTNSWKTSTSFDDGLTSDSSTTDSSDEWDRSMGSTPSPPRSNSDSHVQRGKRISHWIDIAQQCRLLKNFSSLKAIVFGLQSSSICRLTKAWSYVSSERQAVFKELLDLFSSDSNFQIFRQVVNKEATGKRADISPLKKTKSQRNNTGTNTATNDTMASDVVIGIVPYLGTFLSDLTMLHNALPDKNKDGQINFEKRRKEFEIIAKISLFQTASSKYNLPKNPSLKHWIYHTPLLSDDESYHLSIELEPPLPSPTTKQSSTPLCETILRRSLRLLSSTNKKTTPLTVPSDPRIRKSFEASVDDNEGEGTAIYRSNSCFELSDTVVARVSVEGQETTCYYKSIYLSKSDHTSKVIQIALDKHGLPMDDSVKYKLSQQLNGKGKLSLIPSGACVYYALDSTVQPKLFIQLKEEYR